MAVQKQFSSKEESDRLHSVPDSGCSQGADKQGCGKQERYTLYKFDSVGGK